MISECGGNLGFGAGLPGETELAEGAGVLHLPALGAYPLRFEALPTDMLEGVAAVRALELDFTKSLLDEQAGRLMGAMLGMGPGEMLALLRDPSMLTPTQRFLGLWLLHRSGWRVACRLFVTSECAEALAAAALLGREVFGVECTAHTADDSATKLAKRGHDFSYAFPDGWVFPPLIPDAGSSRRIAVARLHNSEMPELPAEGLLVGEAEGLPVRIPLEARDRHVYVAGATGTGKSTLLLRMVLDDIRRGEAVVLIDPHGDLFRDVRDALDARAQRRLVDIDANCPHPPIGLNVLDIPRDDLRNRHIDFLIGELIRFFRQVWNDNPEAFGPVFESYFRNTLMLMLCQPDGTPSLADFDRVMSDRSHREALIATCLDPSVKTFWTNIAQEAGSEISLKNVVPYITSKVSALVQTSFLSSLLCAPRDDLQLARRLDEGAIVLVNLNKGMLGNIGSRFAATLLATRLFAAGLARSLRPADRRPPANIYLDEFQNFVSENLADMFSEARKFGLRLTVANQILSQLTGKQERSAALDSVLGNVGTLVLFRLGVLDAVKLQPFLHPCTPLHIQELPNYHALVRLLTATSPLRPFIMQTHPATK